MKPTPVQPDRDEAERFLTALDPSGDRFTFQTFDDDQDRKDKSLARIFHGTLARYWDDLVDLNNHGAGIFVTVNVTDLKGRSISNVIGIRAAFSDLDGAPLEPVLQSPVRAHIITETSPQRWHAYWLVADGAPLNEFSNLQKALIVRFDADPSVHDLPRVMRIPGFIHRKGDPFFSRICSIDDELPPYEWAELQKAFPPPEPEKPQPPPNNDDDMPAAWRRLNSEALANLGAWVPRLFPGAKPYHEGYRVSSKNLHRNFEEDLSFRSIGIVDFGVADMGDPQAGRRTPIDVVMEHNRTNFAGAVRMLAEALGRNPKDYEPQRRSNGGNDHLKSNGSGVASSELLSRRGLPFRTPADISLANKPWSIKGVIARGEVSSWIGPPAGTKSSLLTDIGVHQSTGRSWRGYRTKLRGGVIYFALERGALVERRLYAYRQRGDLPADAPFAVVSRIIDLLNGQCVQTILDTIKAVEERFGIEAALLIFDTFNKGIAAGGGDEDKAKDQNRVAANMRRVIDAQPVHIAGVGHTGKDESRGERGSNARLADVDALVTIGGDVIRTARIAKANDQVEGDLSSYTMQRCDLGLDEDGDPITTYIVDRGEVPTAAVKKKTGRPKGSPQAQVALSALQLAISECGAVPPASNHIPYGVRTINLALWKDYFLRRSVAGQERTESRDKAFSRASDRLQADGFIAIWGDQVWLTGQ